MRYAVIETLGREVLRRVTHGSTVRVASKVYSVRARLIGEQLTSRLYAERVQLHYCGESVARHERALGKQAGRVDYRHVVHALLGLLGKRNLE